MILETETSDAFITVLRFNLISKYIVHTRRLSLACVPYPTPGSLYTIKTYIIVFFAHNMHLFIKTYIRIQMCNACRHAYMYTSLLTLFLEDGIKNFEKI